MFNIQILSSMYTIILLFLRSLMKIFYKLKSILNQTMIEKQNRKVALDPLLNADDHVICKINNNTVSLLVK